MFKGIFFGVACATFRNIVVAEDWLRIGSMPVVEYLHHEAEI